MDRIAIISDIHGNIPALNAVLSDIKTRGINRIICLGDIAGKGPSSAEAVDMIQHHCEQVVKGNWDFYLTEQESDMLYWHQNKLGKERLAFMKELPIYVEFYMSGRLIRLSHASPNDLFHRTYLHTEKNERLKLFDPTKTLKKYADVIGYGDIHGAHIENFHGKTIFNVGSVGNPLEITQASYAIIEGLYESNEVGPFTISLVRIPYNIDEAIEHALQSDMPDKQAYINELKTGIYRGRAKDNMLEYINGKVYRYAIDFKDDPSLRRSFNDLARKTYGFDFEEWYLNGYWQERYVPYSLVDGEKVISNVSINIIDFNILGEKKTCVQIGTVMTDPDYRNQGLNRIIMERVVEEWHDKCDILYLFANESVLDFYPKFGFVQISEYQYSKSILDNPSGNRNKYSVKKLDMSIKDNRDSLVNYINNSKPQSKLDIVDNASLVMFYTTSFMNENVYYIASLDAIVIADYDKEILYINAIYAMEDVSIDDIINALASDSIKKVEFGFMPLDIDTNDYEVTLLNEEDTTLFIMNDQYDLFKEHQLMFPVLSHA